MSISVKELRRRILDRRGLEVTHVAGAGGLTKRPKLRVLNERHSMSLTYVEEYYKLPIEEVLAKYKNQDIMRDTGVSRTTLWRWRQRLSA